MKIITSRQKAQGAADAWHYQYWRGPKEGWYVTGTMNSKLIYDKLKALDDPTKEQVEEIIGNTCWTMITCEECRKEVDAAVVLNEEDQYGEKGKEFNLCYECLIKAIGVLSGKGELETYKILLEVQDGTRKKFEQKTRQDSEEA